MSLAIGERRDIGRYEELLVGSLSGFGIGMVMAFFQICGMLLVWILWLMRRVRARVAMGPRCLRWRADIASGPAAGEFLVCFMARDTLVVVKGMKGEGGSERVDLERSRATLSGVEGLTEVSS